jgi:hypothetical protein
LLNAALLEPVLAPIIHPARTAVGSRTARIGRVKAADPRTTDANQYGQLL